jgi:hypothetical protein
MIFWPTDPEVAELKDIDIEKFAELIVRECAKRSEELGQPELGKGLMKHFGVEE